MNFIPFYYVKMFVFYERGKNGYFLIPKGYMMWEDTHSLINPLQAPGVEVHCLHGINVTTPGHFVYNNKTWTSGGTPTTIGDDGDGTVNIRSLLGCLKFKDMQKQPVYHQTFDQAEHMQILNRHDVIDYIKKVLVPKSS